MILGVTAVLGAAISNNAGLIVEKRALDRLPPLDPRRPVQMALTLVTRPLWALGFTLLLFGAGLYTYGLALLPLSVAQPLFVVGLALVLVVAAVILAEPLRPAERRGLVVVAVAFALLAASFDARTDKAGVQQHTVLWSAVAAGFAAGSVLVFVTARSGVLYGIAVGLMNAVGGLSAKGAAADLVRHGSPIGLLGYVGVFGVAAALMLGMTQIALQRSRAAAFLPAQVVAGNVAVTAAGTPVFGEHLPDTPGKLVLRMAGFVVALISLAVMQGAGVAPRPPGRHAGATRPVRFRIPFLHTGRRRSTASTGTDSKSDSADRQRNQPLDNHTGRRRSTASTSTDSKFDTVDDQRSVQAQAAAASPIA